MKELKKIFEKYKKIPFPEDSSDAEELGDIFVDLVLYDSEVAGAIDKIIRGKSSDFEDLKYNQALENRLNDFINSNRESIDLDAANKYLEYLLELKKLIWEVDSDA